MRATFLVAIGLAAASAAVAVGQAPPAPANLQAPQDPRYAEVVAKCKVPPAGAQARGGGAAPGRAGGATAGGAAAPGRGAAAAAAAPTTNEYTVTEIPGVIAAGQRWTSVYQTTGNNADGIMATEDGGLLIAQNDNGVVL